MSITNIRDQLKRDEGTVLTEYKDHLGFSTIGTGRLIDKRKGGGISQDEADYLLDNDINKRHAELLRRAPWMAGLDPARFGVMLNMAFQMGVEGLFGFKNTLAMVKDGDYDGAAKGMLQSLWAKQTPARAQRLSKQMATGQWQ